MNEFFSLALWKDLIGPETWKTIYMIVISVSFSHIVGIPMGILLVISEPGHIMEQKSINKVLGFIVNLGRAFPFIILLVVIVPLTGSWWERPLARRVLQCPLQLQPFPLLPEWLSNP